MTVNGWEHQGQEANCVHEYTSLRLPIQIKFHFFRDKQSAAFENIAVLRATLLLFSELKHLVSLGFLQNEAKYEHTKTRHITHACTCRHILSTSIYLLIHRIVLYNCTSNTSLFISNLFAFLLGWPMTNL